MQRLSIPVLAILAVWSASQSALFSSADADDASTPATAAQACYIEQTTITLMGDFAIFTWPSCPDPVHR